MGGSLGGSKNKSKNITEFGQDVWAPQGQALGQLYSSLGSLFNYTMPQMRGQMHGATNYAQGTADQAREGWQNQMQGGAYQNMDLQNQLLRSLAASEGKPSAMSEINAMIMGGSGNNYADAMRNQYIQDANQATENMLANLDARAAASGMSGSSRHGIVQAKGMEDINKNLQSNLARVGYETFDKDLDRKLSIAQAADQNTFARQQLMGNMIGDQQAGMNNAVSQSGAVQNLGMGVFNPYMAPWQAATNYAQAVGGPTVLGSGVSTTSAKGKGGNASASFMGKGGSK